MKGLINTIQFLQPQVIEEAISSINGKIKVVQIFGKPRMYVGRLLYSGGVVNEIWHKTVRQLDNETMKQLNNVLILGLGGGTAAKIISQNFPEAKIVGVEIDKEIIRLGKKYFELDKVNNLKIVCQDAIEYVNKFKIQKSKCKMTIKNSKLEGNKNNFDLIIVDIYLGEEIPEKTETLSFLKNLKKIISPNGFIVFNRLFYKQHKQKAELFIKKLEKIFSKIELARTPANLLVFTQP